MRKLLIILATVVSLGFAASQLWACWGDGYWGGPMGSRGGGYYSGGNSGASYQNFLNDTAKLRQELAARQGEYNALMTQANPDPKKVGELSREIATIHEQLQVKARAYGLDAPASRGNHYNTPMAPYACYGDGYGGYNNNGRGCW